MGSIINQNRAADKILQTPMQKLKSLHLDQNIAIELLKMIYSVGQDSVIL